MSDQITIDRGFFDHQLLMAKLGERQRIINALRDLHIEKNQLGHINTPSGVCGTCRAVAIVKGASE
jgi:hypothetical protein